MINICISLRLICDSSFKKADIPTPAQLIARISQTIQLYEVQRVVVCGWMT
jgi:hypothetical protein